MNLYEILGVPSNASQDEIKKAYRIKAKAHHPDVNNGSQESEELIKLINQAYEVLSEPQLRARYDSEISVDRRMSRWSIPVDLRINFPIDLSLAFTGGKTKLSYLRTVLYNSAPVVTMASVELDIPKRCFANSVIRVPGMGNSSKSGDQVITGDLYVMLSFSLDSDYVSVDRMGNIYGQIEVPIKSILNVETADFNPFPTTSNQSFKIKLEHLGQGYTYQIPGEGFTPTSSIFVKVFYSLPMNISLEDKESLTKIFNKYGQS